MAEISEATPSPQENPTDETDQNEKPSNEKEKRVRAKIPKGCRDFLPEQMVLRDKAFHMITTVFKSHGAVTIDTPVFELKEALTDKYGEDSKLIYDLKDQGGEILALRYDLTVPFARFLASHKISNIKRYHIGKVYRRDQPLINRGRFREFSQCDFDIAGVHPLMVADAEVLKVMTELLDKLSSLSSFHETSLGSYKIKLNHRSILDGIFVCCGVPEDKVRAISSAVDKLDKESWENVKNEMCQLKGLPEDVADMIGSFVNKAGPPREILQWLREQEKIAGIISQALDEMELLFDFLDAMNCLERFLFDLSLARGLDYYTGVIFEAVLTDGKSTVGSIGAGGRYDNLVGGFSGKQVPCVGCSLGIERIMAIMEKAEKDAAAAENRVIRNNETQVLVCTVSGGKQMLLERMRLANELWANGIKAEFTYAENPKMKRQLTAALEAGIPLLVIVGETEIEKNVVQIKNLIKSSQIEVSRDQLARQVLESLSQT